MICAGPARVFVPLGRELNTRHPEEAHLVASSQNSRHSDASSQLLDTLKDFSIHTDNTNDAGDEKWIMREWSDGEWHYEEELYFARRTAIWSRGTHHGRWDLRKTFTVDSPILQALWCDFFTADSKPSVIDDCVDPAQGEYFSAVCILDSCSINIFETNGQDFITRLPFQVKKVWPTKFGLLIERKPILSDSPTPKRMCEGLPIIFTLLHPLDDITPVMCKKIIIQGGISKTCQVPDQNLQIVHTDVDLSLVVTFDSTTCAHSVWKLQRCHLEDENLTFAANETRTPATQSQMGCSTPLTAHIGRRMKPSGITPLRAALFSTPAGTSWLSPQNISSSKTQRAAISRSQTPTSGIPFENLATPPSVHGSHFKKSFSQFHSRSYAGQSCTYSRFRDPLSADISLEMVWTEPTKSYGKCCPASKVFFTNDFTKQRFLCLLIPSKNQLRFVKVEETNDLQQIIFGVFSSISAKDVVPLDGSDLILVLDVQLCLVLYSGVTKVAKIILKVPSSLQISLGTPAVSFLSPESLKSGIVTSSRPPSALEARFDEGVYLLSPVPTENADGSINMTTDESPQLINSETLIGLRDPVRNKVTVVHSSGALYRFSIPVATSSSLVHLCLSAVQKVVPREHGMQLRIKWYCSRFAPGSGDSSPSCDWATFTSLLLGLLGYNVDKLRFEWCQPCNEPRSPDANLKKLKVSSNAQNQDWEDLIATDYHQNSSLCLSEDALIAEDVNNATFSSFNKSCSFFSHFATVFSALHLVYEEVKLNTLMSQEMSRLCKLLQMLAWDLRLDAYIDYYMRDFPHLRLPRDYISQVDESIFAVINFPANFPLEPPSIYNWLNNILRKQEPVSPFPYLHPICKRARDVCLLYAVLLGHLRADADNFEKFLYPIGTNLTKVSNLKMIPCCDIGSYNCYQFAVVCMDYLGVSLTELNSLPSGVVLMLWNALYQCRENPPMTWPRNIFLMLGREDLATHNSTNDQGCMKNTGHTLKNINLPEKATVVGDNKKTVVDDDGMQELNEEVLKLRFNNDLRINEVQRLLQSSQPVKITVVQQPEVSDHEFIDEQERSLYAYCIRTMAIPVGRGIFTVRTTRPIPTETLPIPKLCLTGKAPPRNTTVDLTHIEVPANMNLWPSFHNGVAAGLKVIPNSLGVDSAWIIYNKSRANNDLTTEHAGLLMGLGLNGHLSSLANPNIYNYVSKGQEMTSVGLMLGLAASKRGTMDPNATNLLSIHVDSLLPPTAMELDVPQSVRVAAILGIGLLYEGTAHRHTSEVLLSEIGRPPGPEMENSTDRESYSLAAGLALGLVTFGKGKSSEHVLDMSMASHLCHYMVGGNKHPSVTMGPLKEKYKAPSYQIKEGSAVNIDVTSPGATLALGMMFFASGKRAVAEWMTAPDTQHLLDFVRPDFLLLRTLSKCLILWDEIVPNCAWVESHMPYVISSVAFKTEKPVGDVDFETMRQAYCNILAGACMALGLRFAGSANAEAYKTLMKYMQKTIQLLSHVILEQTGKTTVETCLNVIILSLAMVMAGTGDLEVLRICRYLRSRIGPSHSHVLYGSHMAVHMALGFLFLGGGMYSLSTAPSAIATLICALYPKFPAHSNDNRYHLQAFRHLYVLAVEPRILIPRDVISGHACYVHLLLKFKDTVWYKNAVLKLKVPALLPELRLLEQVCVCDPRYLPIIFERGKNWGTLCSILANNGLLFVKQKTGCLSYMEDPQGYRTLLSQNLVKESFATWVPKPEAIPALTSDPAIRILSSVGMKVSNSFSDSTIEPSAKEQTICSYVGRLLYESVSHEKLETFPALISLGQVIDKCCTGKATAMDIWQLKLAFSFAQILEIQTNNLILRPEIIIALESQMECLFSSWIDKGENSQLLCNYLQGCHQFNSTVSPELMNYLTFYNIPYPGKMSNVSNGERNLPQIALDLAHLQLEPKTIINLFNILIKQ